MRDMVVRERRLHVGAALATVLLLSACTMPGGPPVATGAPQAPSNSGELTAVARNVLTEVNNTRHDQGLHALIEDTALNRAAREHSEELAVRGILDHSSTNPARHTMRMRIQAVGGNWVRAAENLANTTVKAAGVPGRTVIMWLRSDGHRRNMLSEDYTHTGVGVAIDQRGSWYVTQLYALPRAR